MPTKEELTKARDAAIDCINNGTQCFIDVPVMRLAAMSQTLNEQEIAARITALSGDLRAAKQVWLDACGSDTMDHIELANVQVGVTYEVDGSNFATAHEAAKHCTQMYLGPFEWCVSQEIARSPRASM